MKKRTLTIAVLIISTISLLSCNQISSKNVALKTKTDSASYAIGANIGNNLKMAPGAKSLNLDALRAAIQDVINGEELKVTPEEGQAIIQAYFTEAEKKASEEAKVEEDKFFEENGKKEGMKSTDSGIQYEILTEGNGEIPTAEDKVKVHYHGTLIDSTVFDSSVDRDKPAEFGVGNVIKGWTEVLQLMPTGSKWKVYIPSELAYGSQARGQVIKANSTLVFEIELLEILEKEPVKEPANKK